jgi:acyl-[acyl-carrier-protein]-phospholipid O-acyltransferase/long-chain-fatty-acid--[acyl-carrier-protein] ligase
MLAGKISGKTVELGLVPIGGIGLTICCFLLDWCSESLTAILIIVPLLGMFGGIYIVPIDSYIQVDSPNRHRGQIVATANFFGFFGALLASGMIYLISDVLQIEADKGFTLCGFLTGAMLLVITWVIYHHFARYMAMIIAKLHFRITVTGSELLPTKKPSIFICHHTAWNDTLLLLGSQRSPIRFFSESVHSHSRVIKWLYSLLKIVSAPSIELIDDNEEKLNQIKASLRIGVSVCLLIDPEVQGEALQKIKTNLHGLLVGSPYKVVMVELHKGEKTPRSSIFERLLEKVRIPATVEYVPYSVSPR